MKKANTKKDNQNKEADKKKIKNLSYTGPYKKAIDICAFYGVKLIDPPTLLKDTKKYIEKFKEDDTPLSREPDFRVAERAAMIREYSDREWDTLPQPVLVMYTKKPSPRGERFLYLHAIGITKSVADMLSIHLAWTILKENTKSELVLHLNSLGDKDSSAQFMRELSAYYRKHINSLPDDCRESFKEDLLRILTESHEECLPFQEDAPKSINFLSEPSRKHLKEVAEFAEACDIPYIIDHSLVGDKDIYSETIFNICEQTEDFEKSKVFAVGARSDNLTRGAGMRKSVPIVSSVILIPGATGRESIKEVAEPKKRPSIFFIQLAEEARLRSFELLEKLRKAKLPVSQSVGKDKMASQIAQAERLKVPVTLILGQKEALDGTVIVRDMESRSQEIVPMNEVVDKIKALLKK